MTIIRRTIIGLAVTLAVGSGVARAADPMIYDSNTGLDQRYYNGTIADLDRQGLPISDSARAYLKQHGGARAVTPKRGNVYLLEARPAYGAAYGIDYTNHYGSSDDKQRPW
jgi:hypothetical protein